ncbi:MAG: pitrilysin family protein [Bacteroidota bacterium]|nr:pitrilysin family protein [Bacteroidota bacterium]
MTRRAGENPDTAGRAMRPEGGVQLCMGRRDDDAPPRRGHATAITFEECDLLNGLHVIVHEDRHLPLVAVNLWYHVGSKDEEPGKTGFAHLFEHMMFQGSENVPPNGHFLLVQKAGGTLNGSTTFDRTNYYETLPAHQLELGLWLEADRMRTLRLDTETFETQRNVVMEERRSRYDNQPYGRIYESLFERAWKIQPYRWPTIGSMADIRAASLEDARAFHAAYYRPSNASLCIVGDVDAQAAVRLAEKYFGDIPDDGTPILRPGAREPKRSFQVRDLVYDAVPLPAVIIGFHIPPLADDDFLPAEVLSSILASGESSRLRRRLVHAARAAQSVEAYALGLELPGLFIAEAYAQIGHSAQELEDLIFEELAVLRNEGVGEAELAKARNRLETSFVHGVTDIQSRADLLNAYRVLHGDTSGINRELERIRAVTADDLHRIVRSFLIEDNATVVHYLPYPYPSSA